MTNKHEVIALHKKHPDWTAPEIAEKLGCLSAYVRAVAQRCGLDLPKGHSSGLTPKQSARLRRERKLGRAAYAAGFTLAEIKRLGTRGP